MKKKYGPFCSILISSSIVLVVELLGRKGTCTPRLLCTILMNILDNICTFVQSIELVLEERDAEELVLVLQGYYVLLAERKLAVQHIRQANEEQGKYRLCFKVIFTYFESINICLYFI